MAIYGRTRHKVGGDTKEVDCQLRYPRQYEDYETGLYYNRYRYYMPDEGMYSQRDPIRIAGGGNSTLYGYVWDSNREVDVLGLCRVDKGVGQVKPNQVHHFATNKSKKYTARFEKLANKYKLDLDDAWNKELMPHQARHLYAYHDYILEQVKKN